MEEVIVDIPTAETAQPWEPPVVEEPKAPEGSAADVFFLQYAVCILLLTALLLLRLCDESAYRSVTGAFRTQSDAPDLPWAAAFIEFVRNLWR